MRVVQCLFLQFVLSGDVGRKQNEEKGEEEEAQRRKENTLTSGALEFLRISWDVHDFFVWSSNDFCGFQKKNFGCVRFLRTSQNFDDIHN